MISIRPGCSPYTSPLLWKNAVSQREQQQSAAVLQHQHNGSDARNIALTLWRCHNSHDAVIWQKSIKFRHWQYCPSYLSVCVFCVTGCNCDVYSKELSFDRETARRGVTLYYTGNVHMYETRQKSYTGYRKTSDRSRSRIQAGVDYR